MILKKILSSSIDFSRFPFVSIFENKLPLLEPQIQFGENRLLRAYAYTLTEFSKFNVRLIDGLNCGGISATDEKLFNFQTSFNRAKSIGLVKSDSAKFCLLVLSMLEKTIYQEDDSRLNHLYDKFWGGELSSFFDGKEGDVHSFNYQYKYFYEINKLRGANLKVFTSSMEFMESANHRFDVTLKMINKFYDTLLEFFDLVCDPSKLFSNHDLMEYYGNVQVSDFPTTLPDNSLYRQLIKYFKLVN